MSVSWAAVSPESQFARRHFFPDYYCLKLDLAWIFILKTTFSLLEITPHTLKFKDVLTRIDHLFIKTYLYITEALYLVSTSPDTAKYPNMIAGPCKTNITTSYDATLYTKVILSQKKTSKQNWQRYVCEWSLLESHEIPSLAFLEGNCACMEHKGPQREEGGAFGWLSERSTEKTSCPRTF